MRKRFNTTGVCIPERHYMADTSAKLAEIMRLVEDGSYFVINRPRQYGKTTTLFLLERQLRQHAEYLPILIGFEGISTEAYQSEQRFLEAFIQQFRKVERVLRQDELARLNDAGEKLTTFSQLDRWISTLAATLPHKLVLMIDEVDKSGNHQLFLDFLGLLRAKYLDAAQGRDTTFHSVILAGVHDVKSLKLKLRPDDQRQYNSPWNIAVNFTVDLSLSPAEIRTMLAAYCADSGVKMEIDAIAERLHYYTSGYPFLVSAICQILDEELRLSAWTSDNVEIAVTRLLAQSNTNFEHIIKQLDQHPELRAMVEKIVLEDEEVGYNQYSAMIHAGELYGIFAVNRQAVAIHNRLYREQLYNYLASELSIQELIKVKRVQYTLPDQFLRPDQTLDMERVLLKFQEFMRQEYSQRDTTFLERNGRLIFLAFLKPILNGRGFDFKEPQISEEKRLDVVVTFGAQKAIIELKIWRGEEAHQKGVRQLCDYLERAGQPQGYLIIFDFSRQPRQSEKQEHFELNGKHLFAVWV